MIICGYVPKTNEQKNESLLAKVCVLRVGNWTELEKGRNMAQILDAKSYLAVLFQVTIP